MECITTKWKCAKCGGVFCDEVFAMVTPVLYDAELDDAATTGKRECFHYACLEKKEGHKDE